MEIIKKCEDCTYYIQHYIRNESIFSKIDFGHCLQRYRIAKPTLCEKWTEKKDDTLKKELSLKEKLQNISNQLGDICLVINNID